MRESEIREDGYQSFIEKAYSQQGPGKFNRDRSMEDLFEYLPEDPLRSQLIKTINADSALKNHLLQIARKFPTLFRDVLDLAPVIEDYRLTVLSGTNPLAPESAWNLAGIFKVFETFGAESMRRLNAVIQDSTYPGLGYRVVGGGFCTKFSLAGLPLKVNHADRTIIIPKNECMSPKGPWATQTNQSAAERLRTLIDKEFFAAEKIPRESLKLDCGYDYMKPGIAPDETKQGYELEEHVQSAAMDSTSRNKAFIYGITGNSKAPAYVDWKRAPILLMTGQKNSVQDQRETAKLAGRFTGSPIYYPENQTEGLVTDVLETIFSDLGTNNGPVMAAVKLLTEPPGGMKINTIVAHSQGASYTAQALNKLSMKRRQELTVITFGNASMRYPKGPKYVHVVNPDDFIPIIAGRYVPLPGSPLLYRPIGFATHSLRNYLIDYCGRWK